MKDYLWLAVIFILAAYGLFHILGKDNGLQLTEENILDIPLCSTGKKVEVDLKHLKENYPEEYAEWAKAQPGYARNISFRGKICRKDSIEPPINEVTGE